MKAVEKAKKHIMTLLSVFMVVTLSIQAQSQINRLQNQNLDYWATQDNALRRQLEQWTPVLNYVLQSKVVCDSSFISIAGCHIINLTQNMGTVTDSNGDFSITANIGDTVSFSALGYERLTIVITGTMYTSGFIVKLKPTTYDLDELIVTPYRLNLTPISRFEIHTPPLPGHGGINLLPYYFSPVTVFYNRFSKEGKQKRQYTQVVDGTAEYMLIGEKFNGYMVSEITGLKEDELINFMAFCNFSNDFLLNYSMETIRRAIRQKYLDFVEQ